MIFSVKKRREAARKKTSERQEQLQSFIDQLFTEYFSLFVPVHAEDVSNTTMKEPLHALFEKNIAAVLSMKDTNAAEALLERLNSAGNTNAVEALLARFHYNFGSLEIHFQRFDETFRAIFLPEPASNNKPLRLDKSDKELYGAIISGLLETVFVIPKCSYNGVERVSDEVQKNLIDVLKRLDEIRHRYGLLSEIFANLADAKTRLYQEIARVDGFVHLPLRHLPTAALDADELANFCVGQKRDDIANNLARHIINNDGVMLIAGYRGVGKSTFVNSVIAKLSDLEKQLGKSEQLRIVPIKISVAKISSGSDASSVISVLRLCVRAIFHTFLAEEPHASQDDLEKLLDKQEKDFLKWAYLCAMRKVDMQWSESVASLRHLEASLDMKPGELLPKPLSSRIPGSLLPIFGAKASKEWNKRVEHTVSFLDYDEDRAEEDIVCFIEMLARPGKHRGYSIKLVFVFDEMDKLESEQIDNFIKQLKIFFLTPHAVFILVTAKEFYYKVLLQQKEEDSILGSYFSSVEIVPLFTSQDTVQLLLKCLFFIDGKNRQSPTLKDLPPLEKTFIQTVASYLTYRAKGLPRGIISELRRIQQGMPESLQSYITDRSDKENRFQIYAALQEVIESFTSDTVNYEWREQFNRGLYVLIEEFVRFESVILNTEAGTLKEIRERNFNLMAANEFKNYFEILISRLINIKIDVAGNGVTLFSKASDEGNILLTVAKAFYELTGSTADEPLGQSHRLSLEEIIDGLKQENLFRLKEAFGALKQDQTILSEIDTYLYDIFISTQNMHNLILDQRTEFRHSAASYLKNRRTFYHNVVRCSPDQFIAEEANEQLIQDFIQLVQERVTTEDRHTGTTLLLGLLSRCGQEDATENEKPLHLSKNIFKDLISTLCVIAEDDILEEVMKKLDPQQDISSILQPLDGLAKRFDHSVINLLITYNFHCIDEVQLQKLLSDLFRSQEQLPDIWLLAFENREKELARQVVIAIAQQWSDANIEQEALLRWLNNDWDSATDENILERVITTQNHYYFSALESLVSSASISKDCFTRILQAKTPLPTPLLEEVQVAQATTSKGSSTRRKWGIALAMIALMATYFVLPFDLPAYVTLWGSFLRRLCEAVFLYGGVLAISLMILAVATSKNTKGFARLFGIGMFFLLPALICLLVLVFILPLAITIWGQALLIILLIAFWIPLAIFS